MSVFLGAIKKSTYYTITKYLNQKNPSYGKLVQLKNSDVEVGKYLSYGLNKIRSVSIKKLPKFDYVQIKGDGFLYTQDSDGNPKRKSVFIL